MFRLTDSHGVVYTRNTLRECIQAVAEANRGYL